MTRHGVSLIHLLGCFMAKLFNVFTAITLMLAALKLSAGGAMYQGNGWSLQPANGWVAEFDEQLTPFYHPNGVGALQVSQYRKESKITESDVLGLASDHIDAGVKYKSIETQGFQGITFAFGAEGRFWQHWYIYHGSLLLFVTYNCPESDRGVEKAPVESMVQSVNAT